MFDRVPSPGPWDLEQLELELMRASRAAPGRLPFAREALLRWAIGLARLSFHAPLDRDESLAIFRTQVFSAFHPFGGAFDLTAAASAADLLGESTRRLLEELPRRYPSLDPEALQREIAEKRLVLVLGGGGAASYVHLGAMQLLETNGMRPSLVAGSSLGAVLALFRARRPEFDLGEVLGVLRSLRFSRLFRMLSTESRYGLPAPLRLHLRSGIAHYFTHEDGSPYRLADLPIPVLITVSGVRRGMLPKTLSDYEALPRGPKAWAKKRAISRVMEAAELLARPQVLQAVTLGGDWTRELDAVDAAGFSCALPGLIHYDVLREDPVAREGLDRLLAEHSLFRLIDGGLTDNVPAEAAWRQAQAGALGTRNVAILALDPFAPRFTTPLWLPLQRIASENVRSSLQRAHLSIAFRNTLSPTDLLPSLTNLLRAVEWGKNAMNDSMPLLRRMLDPLPPLRALLPHGQRAVALR